MLKKKTLYLPIKMCVNLRETVKIMKILQRTISKRHAHFSQIVRPNVARLKVSKLAVFLLSSDPFD